jgi:hypothetical protein
MPPSRRHRVSPVRGAPVRAEEIAAQRARRGPGRSWPLSPLPGRGAVAARTRRPLPLHRPRPELLRPPHDQRPPRPLSSSARLQSYVRKYGFLSRWCPTTTATSNGFTSTAVTCSCGCPDARIPLWTSGTLTSHTYGSPAPASTTSASHRRRAGTARIHRRRQWPKEYARAGAVVGADRQSE